MNHIIYISGFCLLLSRAICFCEEKRDVVPPIFYSPPDYRPDGYCEKDAIRMQRELVISYARENGLSTNEVIQLICDILEKRLSKTPKTRQDQELIGLAGDALRLLDVRSSTNVLEKTVFTKDIEGRSYAIMCFFSLAREDGIEAAYRMLAKPEVIDFEMRLQIYINGIKPLLESENPKIREKVVNLLRTAANIEDNHNNAMCLDKYLLKADPSWERDKSRKKLVDRFPVEKDVLPYFREVQQKIGKPTTEAEGK